MYKFYIQMDGSTFGPYSAKEVLALGLLPDTLVTEESLNGQWLPASRLDFQDMYMKECGATINEDGSINRERGQMGNDEGGTIYDPPFEDIPSTIKKWNWGAFFFGWLWAVCNGIYWPLVMLLTNFIPYFGWMISIGIAVSLGRQGNEWAWKAKSWNSPAEFLSYQKKWTNAVLWVLGISVILGFIIASSGGF